MKINEKLSEIGFSEETINSLTESQIDQLLSLLLGEATTKTQTVKTTDYTKYEIDKMNQEGEGLNVNGGGSLYAVGATATGNTSTNVLAQNTGFILFTGGTGGSLSPAANTVGNGNALITV
jgi:hypothetical protein